MTLAFRAFRAVDFNWVHDLQNVWCDPVSHVDELHSQLLDHVMGDFISQTRKPTDNPIGKVILGEAGVGKTHLIGALRRRVWAANGWFVLLDIVGITDFWAPAAHGFLNSLCQPMPNGRQQYEAVLSSIFQGVSADPEVTEKLASWDRNPGVIGGNTIQLF